MATEGKSTATPRLRFPEFVGQPWHEARLQDVTAECTIRNDDQLPPEAVMSVTKVDGIVPMKERLIGTDIARYKLVRKDWFAYNPMRLNIGSIARWKRDRDILVSPDYVVFQCLEEPPRAIDPEFLDQFRRSEQWEDYVTQSGIGSVRVRIYYKDVGRLVLKLPQLPEQQKIAACLTLLDDLIAAQERKVEVLKTYKRGLMQQLFPREGETLPRLRFPEFGIAGEWSEKVLVGACEMQAGKFVAASEIKDHFEIGLFPCYGGNGLRGYTQGYSHDGIYPLVGRQGALCGNVRLARGKFHATEHAVVATPNHGIDAVWLFYALDFLSLNRFATGQAQPGLSVDVLEKLPLAIPKEEREQRRIANCLSILDAQITAEAEKLDALKTHKKGLTQQLFPSPDGV